MYKNTYKSGKRRLTMSFEFLKKLPTPKEICEQYPVSEKVARIKKERDLEIKKVITGASDKFLVIIGPCSADNEDGEPWHLYQTTLFAMYVDYDNGKVRLSAALACQMCIIDRTACLKPS